LLVLSNIYEQHVFTIGLWLGLITLNGMCNKDTKTFFFNTFTEIDIINIITDYQL